MLLIAAILFTACSSDIDEMNSNKYFAGYGTPVQISIGEEGMDGVTRGTTALSSTKTVFITPDVGQTKWYAYTYDSGLGLWKATKEFTSSDGTTWTSTTTTQGLIWTSENMLLYAVVRNETGKVKVYKENLYRPMDNRRFIASGTDRSRYYIGELNGKPAKTVYMNEFGITERDISKQTFSNPFGKITGNEICIISLKEPSGNGLCCYRQVNDSDVLTLLEIGDHSEIAAETIARIRADFSNISGVFAVNCAFRYLYFKEHNFLGSYLKSMSSLGSFCGFVGNGEHYNDQFINQSMSCVVFG